jgi:DNA-binding response OmpR family regulator
MAYLSRAGMRVAHAADGRNALAMHLCSKPDLILLDVQLPELDGWAVLASCASVAIRPSSCSRPWIRTSTVDGTAHRRR